MGTTLPPRDQGFFRIEKRKLWHTMNYNSASADKVICFTASDPNTGCARLAFCHLNWQETWPGRHFIFTIHPYGKIKAVPFSFLEISLLLHSSLNASLCLVTILKHCFKASLSLSNLSLPHSKAALSWQDWGGWLSGSLIALYYHEHHFVMKGGRESGTNWRHDSKIKSSIN